MNYYGLFGKFTSVEGKQGELEQILLSAAKLLENNEQCIHYLVSVSNNENEICVYETWTSKEAHDRSLEPEDIRVLIKSAMPLIISMEQISEIEVSGGKGI